MPSLEQMTAVILAGGLGTRLRSVVADRPKILAEVLGRPFICYLLDQLTVAGIRRIVLCTGYLAETVSSLLGNRYGAAELLYSVETSPLGTGGALRLALPLLDSDPVLVLNGDSYCGVDLRQFAATHRHQGARASLVLATVADIGRYGAVTVAPNGTITSFAEKGEQTGAGLINAGIYLLEQRIIATMAEAEPVSLERDIFPGLIGNGLFGFRQSSRFIDIGIPEDYRAAAAFFVNTPRLDEDRP
jgi:NDP-sugar pyrophosphorylase family protein